MIQQTVCCKPKGGVGILICTFQLYRREAQVKINAGAQRLGESSLITFESQRQYTAYQSEAAEFVVVTHKPDQASLLHAQEGDLSGQFACQTLPECEIRLQLFVSLLAGGWGCYSDLRCTVPNCSFPNTDCKPAASGTSLCRMLAPDAQHQTCQCVAGKQRKCQKSTGRLCEER